jgi:prepilin-type N-terminal cleavage/methylation domain-containing protein
MNPNRIRATRRTRGFTLVEVLICTVLLVVAFTALLMAFGQDSRATMTGDQITVATYLADEIRDAALQLVFADVLALDGHTYSPAVVSTGFSYGDANWSQTVSITPLNDADLNQAVSAATAHACRITVTVKLRNVAVVTQTYYMMDQANVPYTTRGN